MKLKFYYFFLALFLLLTSQLAYSQTYANRRIAIYGQNNTAALTNAQFANMTHYVYAFFNPMNTGGDMTNAAGVPNAAEGGSVWFNTGTFTTRIAAARAANPNIKIIISVGGAPASDAGITTRLNTIFADAATARPAMVNDLGAFVQQYNLDGVDLDLEHPTTPAQLLAHRDFLADMKTKLNSLEATLCKDLELSIALNGETDHFVLTPTGSDYVRADVDASVDYYHLMTYDASYTTHNTINAAWPLNHSPLIHCQEAVRDFSSPPFNWAKSKMCIGIPFYGKFGPNGASGTQVYSAMGAGAYSDADDLNAGGYNYNGCPTITNKVNYAKNNGLAGVVVWEGSQDQAGATSLVGCIATAMSTIIAPEQTCCTKPNLGPDLITCSTPFPITLDAQSPGGTYVWTRILPSVTTINAAGANTQVITAANGAGTYVVARTSGSCTRRDTVVITSAAGLPVPALGADKNLCTFPYTITPTNLASFPTGTTWQWQKGGVDITGETSSTIYASTPGTYTLVASLAGCTGNSDAIIISASTVTPQDACRTTAGSVNLSVSGGVGPYTWYTTDVPGNTIAPGSTNAATYATPALPLPSTTYYYVEDAGSGATNYTIAPSAAPSGWAFDISNPTTFTTATISMEFTVTAPVKIRSVQAYPWDRNGGTPATYQSTTWRLEIFNDNNQNVYTSANIVWATYPGYAYQTIPIDANLVEGRYRMRAVIVSGGPLGLFHNNPTGLPFTGAPGHLTVTTQNGAAHSGPFFNWQMSDWNGCQRIRVRAVIGPCTGVLLPVDMVSFNASKNENSILLDWSTSSEENNDYFNIERSIDGVNFTTIGTVQGSGNSASLQSYFFVDHSAPNAVVYYRLAQVDVDGQVNYSQIKVVDNKRGFELTIAPNPFTNNTSVAIKGAGSSVDLKIFDINGRLVETITHNGTNGEVTIGSNLNAGFYILEAASNSSIQQYKFIKE